jgi:DNA primase
MVRLDPMDIKAATTFLNSIPIKEVGRYLGLKLPEYGGVQCPFPDHRDSNPSFSISRTHNRWICYGCGRQGGSIDLVKEFLGTSFIEAKYWLSEKQNGFPIIHQVDRGRPVPALRIPATVSHQPDPEVFHTLLGECPLERTGYEYLQGRAISVNTIDCARVGQMRSPSIRMKKLISQYGFERVYGCGLLTKESTISSYRSIFPDYTILFPFIEDETVAYIQGRVIDSSVKHGRWRNLNFLRRRLYKVKVGTNSDYARFAICEGVIDALSAIELGYSSIALMGVSADVPSEQLLELRAKPVDVLLDWDEAGEKRAVEVMSILSQHGISAIRKRQPSPNVKDLNDYLRLKVGKS